MAYDCGFDKENFHFRFRTGAFLIHNGKMLFARSAYGGYLYMIGGGVRLGETSQSCIEREILEETGLHARADRLAVVCENFFKGSGGSLEGMDCHELEFYYRMTLLDDPALCRTQTDEGEALVWVPVEEIERREVKPGFIRERIREILASPGPLHVLEERDR